MRSIVSALAIALGTFLEVNCTFVIKKPQCNGYT